ncbi:Uma2 family endonuclease [Lentibacillus sp. Marseille-P4043]|uniref:Uma2 family endonuclease n=1 Tax=Lentibacillus sp. Marseille-P4043 TaxID=2040293 RepID=UPI001F255A36|nr:Uma2 family endonuclease [Lentibacillus sp. Marseille-P4043]
MPKDDRKYTYADYLSWPEDVRAEIIDGIPYLQAAASRIHQKVLSELHRQIANFLVGKECEIYPAPFHVVLDLEDESSREENKEDVFEPDITVVCDESKLDDSGCKGNPDMIVEIISPSTARIDKIKKFNKYEQAGVKEYWIVEPLEKIVSVFILQENQHYGRPDLYTDEDQVQVSIFDELAIDLRLVFEK